MILDTDHVDWDNPAEVDSPLLRGCMLWCLAGQESYWGGNKFRDLIPKGAGRGGNHGTLTDMTVGTTSGWRCAHGRPGGFGSLLFDGSDDEVVCSGFTGGTSDGMTSATYMFWVHLASVGSDGGAMLKVGGTSDGFGIGIGGTTFDGPGSALLVLREAVAWDNSGLSWSAGWTHCAIHFSSLSDYAVFWNGVRVWAPADRRIHNAPTTATRLGGYTSGVPSSRHLACRIDDFRCYDRQVNDKEIADVYHDSRRGYPETLRRLKRAVFVPDGGTTTSPSPVSIAASVVAAALSLSHAAAPVAMASGVVGAATSLSHAVNPVAAASTVPAVTTLLNQAATPVSATPAVVTPATSLNHTVSPVSAAASVPAVTHAWSDAPDPVTLAGSAPAVTTALNQALGTPPSAAGSATTPTTALNQAASPVAGTLTVPAVSTDAPGTTTPDPVAGTLTPASVTTALNHALGSPPSAASSVPSQATALAHAAAAVSFASAVAAPATSLAQALAAMTGTLTVPAVTAGRTESPGPVGMAAVLTSPVTALSFAASPVAALIAAVTPGTLVAADALHGGTWRDGRGIVWVDGRGVVFAERPARPVTFRGDT